MERLIEAKKKFKANKKIAHNSKLWDEIYKLLGPNLPYNQYKYHILNDIYEIPKCAITGENCHFIDSKGVYSKYSKEIFKIIKNDANIICSWLNNENLLNYGLSIKDIEKYNKNIKKVRLFFTDNPTLNKKELRDKLISDKFEDLFVEELLDLIFTKTRDTVLDFVIKIYKAKTIKNHELEYWTNRGYTLNESKNILNRFFLKGSKSIESKRKESSGYDLFFQKTRSNGGIESHLQLNRQENRSKVELKLFEELSKKYELKKYYSPVLNEELKQIYNRNNFIHDFYLNDKYIIEYNGGYWHRDFTRFPKFSKDEYMYEIKKAHNCLYEVKRKNNPNYIIIWENDLNNFEEIITFIDQIINLNKENTFFSTREMDYELLERYRKNLIKKEKEKKRFSDIVLRFSDDSHCERVRVGAIAVKERRIIASGINGTPSGYINCDEHFRHVYNANDIRITYEDWKNTEEFREAHHKWSDRNETHAEQSLICEAAKLGIELKNCDIYVSHRPCIHCSKMLTAIGVKKIYYVNEYDKADECSKYLLNSSGIVLEHIRIQDDD